MGTIPGLVQGLCPMCATMGVWMILLWIFVLAAVAALVWMVVRWTRRP